MSDDAPAPPAAAPARRAPPVGLAGTNKRRMLTAQTRNAIAAVQDANILADTIGMFKTMKNMVAWRQQNQSEAAFYSSKENADLCEATAAVGAKLLRHAYPILAPQDYVGDAPAVRVNTLVQLKIGDRVFAPGEPVLDIEPEKFTQYAAATREAGNGGDDPAG